MIKMHIRETRINEDPKKYKQFLMSFKHTPPRCIWQVENDEFGNEKMQSLPSR
jgi:hypothetical protein